MQLHEIQRNHKNQKSRQIGRGGRRGKTSGRGHKGQKARAGHKIRPAMRDEMKRQPKMRGRGSHRFLLKKDPAIVVHLSSIERAYSDKETVSPTTLKEKGVVSIPNSRKARVKILANGALETAVTVDGCEISDTAREQIENAGGKVKASA